MIVFGMGDEEKCKNREREREKPIEIMEVKTIFHILPQVILFKREREREREGKTFVYVSVIEGLCKDGRWNLFLKGPKYL